MSTGIIIQARNNSSRLPNKLLLPFYKDAGILEILLSKISMHVSGTPVVLATTKQKTDDVLVDMASRKGVETFRGSESNVLDRFVQAARLHNFDKVVRICSDNPFLDMSSLSFLIQQMKESDYEYWCFSTAEKLPSILTHYGFWAEGASRQSLEKVAELTRDRFYFEHVTNYLYTHPDSFQIKYNPIDPVIDKEKSIRLTVDTPEDFKLVKLIYEQTKRQGIPENSNSLVEFIKKHPEWIKAMQAEIRKNSK